MLEVLDVELAVRIGTIPGWAGRLLARHVQDVLADAFGGRDLEGREVGHGRVGFCGTRGEWHGFGGGWLGAVCWGKGAGCVVGQWQIVRQAGWCGVHVFWVTSST